MSNAQQLYSSYNDVPVYRRQWFFWLMYFTLPPVAIGLLLFGNVYCKRNNTVELGILLFGNVHCKHNNTVECFGVIKRIVCGLIAVFVTAKLESGQIVLGIGVVAIVCIVTALTKRTKGWIAAACVSGVMISVLLIVFPATFSNTNYKVLHGLQKERDRMVSDSQHQLDTQGFVDYPQKDIDAVLATSEAASNRLSGRSRDIAKASLRVQQALQHERRLIDAIEKRIEKMGGLCNPSALLTVASIREQRILVEEERNIIERLKAKTLNAPEAFKSELMQMHMTDAKTHKYIASFTQLLQVSTLAELRKADLDTLDLVLQLLDLLERSFGKWSVGKENNVVLQRSEDMVAWNAIFEKMKHAVQRTEVLQRKYVSASKSFAE